MNDPTQIFIGNQELTINKNITQIVEVVQEWEKNKKFIDFFEKTCIVAGSKVTNFLTLIFAQKLKFLSKIEQKTSFPPK